MNEIIKHLEEKKALLKTKVQERDALVAKGFKTNLQLTLAGRSHVISSMWGINGGNHHVAKASFVENSRRILGLASEINLVNMADQKTAEDFGVEVNSANAAYYADLLTSYEILKMNYEIEQIRLDIQTTNGVAIEKMIQSHWKDEEPKAEES